MCSITTLPSKIFVCAESDSKISSPTQKFTTYLDEMETCRPQAGFSKVIKSVFVHSGTIADIKFFPVLLDYQANYDEIRGKARENVMFFSNDKKHFHGNTSAFKSGKVFLLVHGFTDMMDSDLRIFGIGE